MPGFFSRSTNGTRLAINGACLLALAAGAGALACRDVPHSAAADVSTEDVRRLPPSRKGTLRDIMMEAADRGRVLGDSAHAKIYVISDFQCATCRQWYDNVLPQLRTAYFDTHQATLTWVHYPLREHPNAVRAASAAMCASVQGKFWEAGAKLFASQAQWGGMVGASANVPIDSIAGSTGVDPYAYRSCVESGRLLRQIRGDIDWVDKAGHGTPLAIVVGTRRLTGTTPVATLRATIDSVLAGK
jgi:hypothetical protein